MALTEPNSGSAAIFLETTATKTEGGYILNGEKRWPGNGTFADYILVWAVNQDDNDLIQGFIVETAISQGLTISKIEGK